MARERRSRSSFWRKDSYLMHATERQRAILTILGKRGFIAFRDLETHIEGSPTTLRRGPVRMSKQGAIHCHLPRSQTFSTHPSLSAPLLSVPPPRVHNS